MSRILALTLLLTLATPSHGGEVRQAKRIGRALAKPVRVQARADNGWPFRTTVANTSQVAANLSGNLPVAVAIGVLRFITQPVRR